MDASVMIIEDCVSVREPLAALLRFKGYVVVETENGRDALKKLRALPLPSLVLLDLMMPVMDGWSFLKEKEADRTLASIPVIILSAVAKQGCLPRIYNVVDVMQKPGDIPKLFKLMNKYCVAGLEKTTAL